MEDLSPTLYLLWDVKRSLEKGQSIQTGIKIFLAKPNDIKFHRQVEQWWQAQNHKSGHFDKSKVYMTRKYLLDILEVGLTGQSILETLKVYEKELIQNCEDEVQAHLSRLPLLLLFPLMGMIFPALMLLLIGPLLSSLTLG